MNALTIDSLELINTAYKYESRSFCPGCEFLRSRCLCDTIAAIDNKTKIIILQHKIETKHALNTTRILVKSLKNISLIVGENFSDHEELNAVLSDPENKCALIFPTVHSAILKKEELYSRLPLTHILLLDGTWRKAKKIFFLSKNLHSLTTLKIEPEVKSDYRLRKSPIVTGLSTLEAAVHVLGVVEPELPTENLLRSFRKMIDLQIEKMGKETYKKNYKDNNEENEND